MMIEGVTPWPRRPGGVVARLLRTLPLAVSAWLSIAPLAGAQTTSAASIAATPQSIDSFEAVAAQIRELQTALDGMREQLKISQRESEKLRDELRVVRTRQDSLQPVSGQVPGPRAGEPTASDRIDALVEEQELLRAKVEDQEQTKIESASKYHVRLSGLALLNLGSVSGSVDNLDLPGVALARLPGESGGSFSASSRQSRLGLEVFGPMLGGARTTGSVAFDFFGGFPITRDGVGSPLVRLRTATFTLDWQNTSVLFGQDAPFFSPLSPTSLASTTYPALSAAGNLWAWTLQVHVDHRIPLTDDSTMLVQWGVLDPLTGELPAREYDRTATAGERTGIPAQAIRVGWQHGADARRVVAAAGAYHATQDWGYGRGVDAWAATADWEVPLGGRFALSGELYRGRAIAGLGGGASDSVLFGGPASDPSSSVLPVSTAGGWSQLKYKPATRLELNVAFGGDNPLRNGGIRLLPAGVDRSPVNRNRSGFMNVIYQARANLLFSVEYRRLWTTALDDTERTADHVSFSTGVVF